MKLLKLFSVFALALLTGCGGGSGEEQQAGQETAQAQGERTIEIIGVNSMKFTVEESTEGITVGEAAPQEEGLLILESIMAQPGETLHITLTTRSSMPAAAMSHNWILLTQAADPDAFVNAAIRAKDNSYIPLDLENEIIAHTDLASGGETVEVTFTAPEQPGEYVFLCSFPGHYVGGMKGTLIVQE